MSSVGIQLTPVALPLFICAMAFTVSCRVGASSSSIFTAWLLSDVVDCKLLNCAAGVEESAELSVLSAQTSDPSQMSCLPVRSIFPSSVHRGLSVCTGDHIQLSKFHRSPCSRQYPRKVGFS